MASMFIDSVVKAKRLFDVGEILGNVKVRRTGKSLKIFSQKPKNIFNLNQLHQFFGHFSRINFPVFGYFGSSTSYRKLLCLGVWWTMGRGSRLAMGEATWWDARSIGFIFSDAKMVTCHNLNLNCMGQTHNQVFHGSGGSNNNNSVEIIEVVARVESGCCGGILSGTWHLGLNDDLHPG